MEPQKPGTSAVPGSEVVERQRVRSWTVQNKMRGVHKRAGKILDSADPKQIRA